MFTDNLFLTASDEEQDFVTELTPRINIYGNGRRATDDVSDSGGDDPATGSASSTDSTSQRYYAKIESGSRFNELPWSATFERKDIDYENADSTTLQELLGTVGFVYSRELRLVGSLGYEDNKFRSAGDPASGIIWDVGVRWTPSGRTTLEATYGRRFFGDRYFFNLSHESRRTKWHVTYDEVPYTARQAQIDESVAPGAGRFQT